MKNSRLSVKCMTCQAKTKIRHFPVVTSENTNLCWAPVRVIRRHPGIHRQMGSRFRPRVPVSRHGISLETFPCVFSSSEYLLSSACISDVRLSRKQICLTARLQAVPALSSIQIILCRSRRDNMIPEIRIAPSSPSGAVYRGSSIVVITGIVTAGTVSERFWIRVLMICDGMR